MSQKKYDVAIYGATMGANYGGLVTYYALYKAIEEMGYSVVMIMPPIPKDGEVSVTFATTFCQKYHEVTERVNFDDLKQFNDIADTFVLGSDQIWNHTLFKGKRESFYLDFVDDKKKKIAYAASFGTDQWEMTPSETEECACLAKMFDAISVREESGVSLCKQHLGVDAVLIPVDRHHFKITITDRIDTDFCEWIDGYGCCAKILSPQDAIDFFRAWYGDNSYNLKMLYEHNLEPSHLLTGEEIENLTSEELELIRPDLHANIKTVIDDNMKLSYVIQKDDMNLHIVDES